jgi:hypothetical protein
VTKMRLDMADLTLGELADVTERLGVGLQEALQGPAQPRAMAAIVWIIRRRDDPTFTFEQALEIRMADLEVETSGPEAPAGDNGAAPPMSLAPGG